MGRFVKLESARDSNYEHRCELCNNLEYFSGHNSDGSSYLKCKLRNGSSVEYFHTCKKFEKRKPIPGWDTYDESEWE